MGSLAKFRGRIISILFDRLQYLHCGEDQRNTPGLYDGRPTITDKQNAVLHRFSFEFRCDVVGGIATCGFLGALLLWENRQKR